VARIETRGSASAPSLSGSGQALAFGPATPSARLTPASQRDAAHRDTHFAFIGVLG
jgi:hypothetical protein